MREEEIFVFCVVVAAFVFSVRWVTRAWSQGRDRKFDILERALGSGQLDDTTKQVLIAELTKPGPAGRIVQSAGAVIAKLWAGGRILVAVGWLGMFLGGGIALSGSYRGVEMGLPLALFSFGILTVPFAMRELEARRPASERSS